MSYRVILFYKGGKHYYHGSVYKALVTYGKIIAGWYIL